VDEDLERRRRIRRSVIVLAIVAASFYFGFILLSVMRSHG
jgi:hypothetical protein